MAQYESLYHRTGTAHHTPALTLTLYLLNRTLSLKLMTVLTHPPNYAKW